MKHTVFFIVVGSFFLFTTPFAYGQDIRDKWQDMPATPQSFATVMRMETPSEAQFDSLWNIVQQYCATDADTCLLLTTHAIGITKNHPITRLHGEALYLHGKAVIEQDAEAGLDLLYSAREILKNEKGTDAPAVIESFLGLYFSRINEFEKALEYQLNALEFAKASKDTSKFVTPLMAIGGIYFQMRSLEKAQEYISEAIKMQEATGDEQPIPALRSNQAMVFQQIGNGYLAMADTATVEAAKYHDSAELNFTKGLKAAEKGLAVARKTGVPTDVLGTLTRISSLQNSLEDYGKGEKTGREAMLLAEQLGIPFFLAGCHLNLSVSLRNLGRNEEALHHAQAGYAIVNADVRAGKMELFEEELMQLYKTTGRPELALPLMEKSMKRLRHDMEKRTSQAIADAETKYKTAEKEMKILELDIENEKVSRQRNYLLGGSVLLGIFSFMGYRFNRVHKDRNDKKAFAEALIFAQEEERKRIGREL
ncbi:MAG: hypothetical protein R2795_27325, partial [Saprospiraceae bacterium]